MAENRQNFFLFAYIFQFKGAIEQHLRFKLISYSTEILDFSCFLIQFNTQKRLKLNHEDYANLRITQSIRPNTNHA